MHAQYARPKESLHYAHEKKYLQYARAKESLHYAHAKKCLRYAHTSLSFFSVLRRNRFGGSEVWSFYSKNPPQLYQIHQIRTYVPLQSKPFATVSDPSDQKLCSFMIEIPTRPFTTASDRKFCSFQSRSPTRPFTTVLRPADQKLCSFMVETPDETLYNRIRSIYPHPPGKTPVSLG